MLTLLINWHCCLLRPPHTTSIWSFLGSSRFSSYLAAPSPTSHKQWLLCLLSTSAGHSLICSLLDLSIIIKPTSSLNTFSSVSSTTATVSPPIIIAGLTTICQTVFLLPPGPPATHQHWHQPPPIHSPPLSFTTLEPCQVDLTFIVAATATFERRSSWLFVQMLFIRG